MLGLGDARHDDPVEIGEDVGERLGLFGGVGREGGADLTGLDLGGDREGRDALAVVGDPVDEFVGGGAELLGRHTPSLGTCTFPTTLPTPRVAPRRRRREVK